MYPYRRAARGCYIKPEPQNGYKIAFVNITSGEPQDWKEYVLGMTCVCSKLADAGYFALTYQFVSKLNKSFGGCIHNLFT